jgi:hypothetical protein
MPLDVDKGNVPGATSAGLRFQNTLFVDATYGNDATAQREDPERKFKTVGAAIAAAQTNDTLLLSPGIYSENIVAPTLPDGLVIASMSSPGLIGGTLIQNAAPGDTFNIVPGIGDDNKCSGLTFIDVSVANDGSGWAVYIDGNNIYDCMNNALIILRGALTGNGSKSLFMRRCNTLIMETEIGGGQVSLINVSTVFASTALIGIGTGPTMLVEFDPTKPLPIGSRGPHFWSNAIFGVVALVGAPNIVMSETTAVGQFDGTNIQSFPANGMSINLTFEGWVTPPDVHQVGFGVYLPVPDAGYTPALASSQPIIINFDEAVIENTFRIGTTGAPPVGVARVEAHARQANFSLPGNVNQISVGDFVDLDIRGSFYQQVQLAVDGFSPGPLTPDHGTINRDYYSPANWLTVTLASGAVNTYQFIPYPDANQYGILVTQRDPAPIPGFTWAITAKTSDSITIVQTNPGALAATFDLEFVGRRWKP